MKLVATTFFAGMAFPALAFAQPADLAAAVANEARAEANRALDEARKPAEVLTWAGLEQGDDVLDLFGGNLYWGEIMHHAVGGEGSLTVWQPTQFFSDEERVAMGQYIGANKGTNLITARFEELTLGENAYDFIIVNLNVHDFFWESERFDIGRMDPDAHARQMADALKPGGKLLVIDHRGAASDDVRAQVEATHRIDPEAVKVLFAGVGLALDKEDGTLLANADDDLSVNVFNPAVRGKTDRFMQLYVKGE